MTGSLVLIMILLLYSYGSYFKQTRESARVLLFSYLIGVVISTYPLSLEFVIYINILIHVVAFVYVGWLTDSNWCRFVIAVTLIITPCIFLSVIYPTSIVPWEYSQFYYKESLLLVVSGITSNDAHNKDGRLILAAIIMWLISSFI